MTKLSSSSKYLLFAIIGLVLVAILLGSYNFLSNSPIPSQPTPPNTTSQRCGVCGPKGTHNVKGAECASGLVCKRGETTSLSYCVKSDEPASMCENQTNNTSREDF